MDYIFEQTTEFEALESIYYGDLTLVTAEPFHKFSIYLKTENFDCEEKKRGIACTLLFCYTEKYPDEPALVEVENVMNLDENDRIILETSLKDEMNKNLGSVMIFTIVSVAQDWLNSKWEGIMTELEKAKLKKQTEEEEKDRKRFEGTPVTVETFLKWQIKFEEEMKGNKPTSPVKDSKRLTGRELFMRDITLNESDLQFLEGANVQVDESLFQDFDDLEIEDDELSNSEL